MKVRRAGPADFDAVRPLVALLHAHEELPPAPETDHALRRLLANPRLGRVLVGEDDTGALLGYVVLGFGFSLEFHGTDAFVDELFVLEAHRGHGVGALLMAAAEGECRSIGIHALHLEVTHANPAAALYERQGYKRHQRHLMTKWLAKDGHDPD
ncbi:MAG: hypothetical protein QOD77_680 [Thermoplasmata archaeon]|jgi:GNAT superfamily N-acetyltransferase|nr:hypothetical protein [Thermoplasmata archaeon]